MIMDSNMLNKLRGEVEQLAVRVGQYLAERRKHFADVKVESKHAHDYVTDVDKASERMIVEQLTALLPEAGFVTEEKTVAQADDDKQLFWVVDPLDGTTNFIHGLTPYCVSIALRSPEDILLGVVYEPVCGELFSAALGQGATLNGKPIHVSSTENLDKALVCMGYPYDAENYMPFCLGMTKALYGHCASLRSFGSAESELCYLAAGRIDVYFESYIQPWDVAAGACVLREAGGQISDYTGTDRLWNNGQQVLATNGHLHPAMLLVIEDVFSGQQ